MNYGYFDNEHKEYIITNPKTPVTWINYIGSLKFGGFVDQTGGSLVCKGDPALNRIVKYIPQLPNSEFKGETLYLRLKTDDGYRIFSPFYVPTLDKYDFYQCRVGLGYNKYISEIYGIRTEVIVFIPDNDHRVIRDIKITNLNERGIEIDVIPVVEYTHFDALKQFTNADWVPQTMQSKLIEENSEYKILTQYAFMNKDTNINFFASNLEISSFESDRNNFLGDNGYGTWQLPKSLLEEELSNYEALRGENIGALMHHLGEVKKDETKRVIVQLGQCENIDKEKELISKFRSEENVDKAFGELLTFWDDFLSAIHVNTPNEDMNTMLNIHNPRQCYITKNWSRYLSLYQLGFGSRGIGVRDSSQDVLGVISHIPEESRELIEMLLSVQRSDGSAMHQFNPITMEANEGDSREMNDRPDYYSDDHLWIILAVCAYIKESGNLRFISKKIPFYKKDKTSNDTEEAEVLEHLKRGIEFTRNNIGKHGLPLLGFADWNDTVNLMTGSESMFTANLYGLALKEMIELSKVLEDKTGLNTYQLYYDDMKKSVNCNGWDGEWFIRYFDADGNPLGSKDNDYGQIYVNAQSWSVFSGFASEEYAETALNSVNNILNTNKGIKLSYPGFNKFHPEKGGITTYPPGAKENGGIFLHSNPWVIIAETKIGNGNRALEYYNQINPVTKNSILDEYECEPYCYPQNILGDEHPQFGLARNSWLSGTASWMYQAAIKYILGIQPDYNGLRINPCIPREWDGFKAIRKYRNATYDISVINPEHISKGIKEIMVDDQRIEGNVIPVFGDNSTHKIIVVMG
ncbi:MAG: GH36-type glycosyl hydrolase domain-containing protein [Eubacteriales bacterium]